MLLQENNQSKDCVMPDIDINRLKHAGFHIFWKDRRLKGELVGGYDAWELAITKNSLKKRQTLHSVMLLKSWKVQSPEGTAV